MHSRSFSLPYKRPLDTTMTLHVTGRRGRYRGRSLDWKMKARAASRLAIAGLHVQRKTPLVFEMMRESTRPGAAAFTSRCRQSCPVPRRQEPQPHCVDNESRPAGCAVSFKGELPATLFCAL